MALCSVCSQQLAALADKVQDERFWAGQQPHYGTDAAKRLLQSAAERVSLPSLELPPLPQLPASVQLPAFRLPAAPQLPDISGGAALRSVQEAAAGLAQACFLPAHLSCLVTNLSHLSSNFHMSHELCPV